MEKYILVIDGDVDTVQKLKPEFSGAGFQVMGSVNFERALPLIREFSPSLIIIDVKTTGASGIEICKSLRELTSTPLMILSSSENLSERIHGLNLGADDYVLKPFDAIEILARTQAILRRKNEVTGELDKKRFLRFGSLELDFEKRRGRLNGLDLHLTNSEFETLAFLSQHSARVLSRDEIVSHLKGIDSGANGRGIDIIISRVRQKLNDSPKQPTFLRTIWGSGYVFIASRTGH